MPAPDLELFENDSDQLGNGTAITEENPITFGLVPKGIQVDPEDDAKLPVHLWNDKSGVLSADEATSLKVYCVAVGGDNDIAIFNGTTLNGDVPMLEARSRGALNCDDDAQTAWTPIGPSDFLDLGDMPSNSRRNIELRLNVPIDAPNEASVELRLAFTFA